jgi:hypothetical protein
VAVQLRRAVLLVVASVLGVLLVRNQDALNDARQSAASLSSILDAGDAKAVAARSAPRLRARGDLPRPEPWRDPRQRAGRTAERATSTRPGCATRAGDDAPGRLLPGAGTTGSTWQRERANGVALSVEPTGGRRRRPGPGVLVNLPAYSAGDILRYQRKVTFLRFYQRRTFLRMSATVP